MCVWGWRGWLPPQSQQKHTRTHTSDSMVKLILLHCLETCLLLCAVTLISPRQSHPGYKICVFCSLLSFLSSLSLCPVILSTNGMWFPSLDILINGCPELHPPRQPWPPGASALDDCTHTFIQFETYRHKTQLLWFYLYARFEVMC